MTDFTCLVFGRDDKVLDVHSFNRPLLGDAIKEATALALSVEDTRGFQLWSAGKVVCSQLSKGGANWTDLAPSLS